MWNFHLHLIHSYRKVWNYPEWWLFLNILHSPGTAIRTWVNMYLFIMTKAHSLPVSSLVHSSQNPLRTFLPDRATQALCFFIPNCCLLHRLNINMKRWCCNWDNGHRVCDLELLSWLGEPQKTSRLSLLSGRRACNFAFPHCCHLSLSSNLYLS